jgi:hypothetical protein
MSLWRTAPAEITANSRASPQSNASASIESSRHCIAQSTPVSQLVAFRHDACRPRRRWAETVGTLGCPTMRDRWIRCGRRSIREAKPNGSSPGASEAALPDDLNGAPPTRSRSVSGRSKTLVRGLGQMAVAGPLGDQSDRANVFWDFRPPPRQPQYVGFPSLDRPDSLNHAVKKSGRKSKQKHPV